MQKIQAELGDTLVLDYDRTEEITWVTEIKLTTPDSVVIANHILADEEGWRLIKNE